MTLQPLPSGFPYIYEENFVLFFISEYFNVFLTYRDLVENDIAEELALLKDCI